MANENSQMDQYWESRTLCSDEGCIGVIGPNGRCKECGKKYEGAPSGLKISAEGPPRRDDAESAQVEVSEPATGPAEPVDGRADDLAADSDWENRTLCSDENCIGVIGPDGRCKECGKPFEKS